MVIINHNYHVDEVEAPLHFDECELTFCNAKHQ